MNPAIVRMLEERDAEIEQGKVALKIAAGNIAHLNDKSTALTKALITAMALIDQLVTENGRLCAASDSPPPVALFAAKNSFDTEMKKLLEN